MRGTWTWQVSTMTATLRGGVPATAAPAMKTPGTLVSIVCGSCFGWRSSPTSANLAHRSARQVSHETVADQRAHFRQQPELDHFRIEVAAAIADGHLGAGAMAAHRRLGRGIPPADDEQPLAEVRVRIAEIVA